jgi:hypothetical protein
MRQFFLTLPHVRFGCQVLTRREGGVLSCLAKDKPRDLGVNRKEG